MEIQQNTVYAGFWLRFVAHLIDVVVIQVLQSFLIVPFLILVGLSFLTPDSIIDEQFPDLRYMREDDIWIIIPAIIMAVFAVIAFLMAVQILYFTIMESSRSQATLGKMAIGLKVTDMEGERLDFIRAFMRQLGKILSGMTMMIGYIMAGFTPKKQALHDILANTLVVHKNESI